MKKLIAFALVLTLVTHSNVSAQLIERSGESYSKNGEGIVLTLPKNKIHLSVNDLFKINKSVNFSWRKISGPNKFKFSDEDSASTLFYDLIEGVYYVELTVWDKQQKKQYDTIKVSVTKKAVCQGKRIYLTKKIDNTISIDGNSFKYSPGDTLVLKAKDNPFSVFTVQRIHGTQECPVVIINEGGQLQFNFPNTAVTLSNCTHVKLLGTGSADLYGFAIYNNPLTPSGVGVQIDQRSKDVEVSNVYIHNKSFAFWVKQEQSCADSLQFPNWVIDSITIHDTYCRRLTYEGLYLGSTDPNSTDPWRFVICNGDTLRPKPLRLGDIQVYNNIVDSTGRSGIQLSSASFGINKIYNNTVMHSGFEFNSYGQGNGISIGGYTHAQIYNNTIRDTYTNGISSFGAGLLNIHDNVIDSSGVLSNQTVPLIASIMIDTRPTFPADSTKFYVVNNKFGHNTDYGLRVYKTYSTYKKGNIVCSNIGTVTVFPGIDWTKNCSALLEKTAEDVVQTKMYTNADTKTKTYLYPNPAAKSIFVNIGNNYNGKLIISIYDQQARIIQSRTVYKNATNTYEVFNISSLANGLYFLQITNGKEKSIMKFIKSN